MVSCCWFSKNNQFITYQKLKSNILISKKIKRKSFVAYIFLKHFSAGFDFWSADFFCAFRSSSSSASNPNQLYQQLYEVFGDSLTPRVAFNNWQDPAVTRTNLMRIQPIAHAYFPLRPLQRNSSSIRELIQKASEQMKGESVKGDQAVMRKRPKMSEFSPPKTYVASEQGEAKTMCFLLRSSNKKLNPIRNDYWETDISSNKIKGRKPECDKSCDRPLKRKYPNSGSCLIGSEHQRPEVGNIRRRFRRTRPVITNGTKYDFHLGVIL